MDETLWWMTAALAGWGVLYAQVAVRVGRRCFRYLMQTNEWCEFPAGLVAGVVLLAWPVFLPFLVTGWNNEYHLPPRKG